MLIFTLFCVLKDNKQLFLALFFQQTSRLPESCIVFCLFSSVWKSTMQNFKACLRFVMGWIHPLSVLSWLDNAVVCRDCLQFFGCIISPYTQEYKSCNKNSHLFIHFLVLCVLYSLEMHKARNRRSKPAVKVGSIPKCPTSFSEWMLLSAVFPHQQY